jgi:hypothetical protein
MAGIQNNSSRVFNLKGVSKGTNVTVRLQPGFNVVTDEAWKALLDSPNSKYINMLREKGSIDFGNSLVDNKELDATKDQEASVSTKKVVKKKKSNDVT